MRSRNRPMSAASCRSATKGSATPLLVLDSRETALTVEAERLGVDGTCFRVHRFARQLASPFPLLAAVGAKTQKIETGTVVIDMRYENPHYMAEDADAADLIAGWRLQLDQPRFARASDRWVGAILAKSRVKARTMQTWADATPKSFSNCYAARDSLNRTHIRCFQVHQGCCVSSGTLKDCVIGSAGVRVPMRSLSGPLGLD